MAQMGRRRGAGGAGGARRAGESLLRRYGLDGRRAPLLAGVALAALLAVGALALGRGGCSGLAGGLGSGSSFAIERGDGSEGSGGSDGGDSSASNDASARGRASAEEDSGGSDATDSGNARPSSVIVHVDGAVAAPGVYRIEAAYPRVDDAVRAAGGLTAEAETVSLNLAAPVTDGQKVHVPVRGEAPVATTGAGTGAAGAGASAGGAAGAASDQSGGLVNINTADAAALQTLPGVGEATARAIVEDREKNGPFSAKEDIMRVSGIGEKKFERMRDSICV